MQKWYFKPVGPSAVITGALFTALFFLSAWHGHLNGRTLYACLFGATGILSLSVTLHSLHYWLNLRRREEIIVLDNEWLYYKAFPCGEGGLKYEWLKSVSVSAGINGNKLLLEHLLPEPSSGRHLRRTEIDLSRLIHPQNPHWMPFAHTKAAEILCTEITSRRAKSQPSGHGRPETVLPRQLPPQTLHRKAGS